MSRDIIQIDNAAQSNYNLAGNPNLHYLPVYQFKPDSGDWWKESNTPINSAGSECDKWNWISLVRFPVLDNCDFNEIAERWQRETAIYSSPGKAYLHRDYMTIITKGVEHPEIIVPLILDRLSRHGGDWFFALESIAGENPANECESYQDALDAWCKWARSHEMKLNNERNAVSTT